MLIPGKYRTDRQFFSSLSSFSTVLHFSLWGNSQRVSFGNWNSKLKYTLRRSTGIDFIFESTQVFRSFHTTPLSQQKSYSSYRYIYTRCSITTHQHWEIPKSFKKFVKLRHIFIPFCVFFLSTNWFFLLTHFQSQFEKHYRVTKFEKYAG